MREVRSEADEVGCGSGTCVNLQENAIARSVLVTSDYFKIRYDDPSSDAGQLWTKEEWQVFRRQIKNREWDHIFPDEISEHERAMDAGECVCGTTGLTYEGPVEHCPQHGRKTPPPAEILIVSTNQEVLNDPTAVRLVNQEVRDRFEIRRGDN